MVLANLIIVAMICTYILLATQAEPVTATFGYIFAGILTLALLRGIAVKGKE